MSDTMFRMFQNTFTATAALLYAGILTAFMKPFLAAGTQQDCRKNNLTAGTQQKHRKRSLLIFSLHLAGWIFCSRTVVPHGAFFPVLLALLLMASRTLDMDKSFTFLLVLFYCNARTLSGLIVESGDFIMERLLSAPVDQSDPEDIYLHAVVQSGLFALSHIILLIIMLFPLRQRLRKNRSALHWQEICYLGLIPAAGILFGQMVSVLLFEVKNGIPLWLFEQHPLFLGAVPALALLFYIGTYFTVTFWQSAETLRREREELFSALQQTRAIQEQMRESEFIYTRFGQMKHEMRGHLNNIHGLAMNGQYKELEQYIARMDDTMHDFDLTIRTGNAVTDVIINSKRQQCLEQGIDFQVDFHYPASGQYDAFDLGIILQNLLSNALEACGRLGDGTDGSKTRKYISLTSRQTGKFFLIEVRNPFSGEIQLGPDGLPVTTKTSDTSFHGIGLSNVRREAEKYMGELELNTEHQQFCATILLQERRKQ